MRFPLLSSLLPTSFLRGKQASIRPVVLIVIDGWGVAPASTGNAIERASLPYWRSLLATYPNTELIASGESVGLPANEVGNSEVGHLTIGAGRVISESLLRINRAIEDGSFLRNKALLDAVEHSRQFGSTLHLMGLVGSGNVHSSTQHLYALLKLCKLQKIPRVALHLFTDGRDAPPRDGVNVVTRIEFELQKEYPFAKIASLSGRYFALDRDNHWERTQKVYDALTTGSGAKETSAVATLSNSYLQGKTDEFIEPTVIGDIQANHLTIEENDAVIFFNFRVDRPRQLAKAFVIPDFESGAFLQSDGVVSKGIPKTTFTRQKTYKNLFFVTMTEYQKEIPVSGVAFPNERVEKPMSEILSEHNYTQLHLAESEKERMVTYYFDGLRTQYFDKEDVVIVPSPRVGTYDRKPEMALPGVQKQFLQLLSLDKYQFFVCNFANPDMVAHSGKTDATIKACQEVDHALSVLVEAVLSVDGSVFITADHGNAEELLTYDASGFFFTSGNGSMNTEHSNNPVPFVFVANAFKGKPTALSQGTLADVAPTMLTWMKLPIPKEMTGKNLLKETVPEASVSEK